MCLHLIPWEQWAFDCLRVLWLIWDSFQIAGIPTITHYFGLSVVYSRSIEAIVLLEWFSRPAGSLSSGIWDSLERNRRLLEKGLLRLLPRDQGMSVIQLDQLKHSTSVQLNERSWWGSVVDLHRRFSEKVVFRGERRTDLRLKQREPTNWTQYLDYRNGALDDRYRLF